MGDDATLETLQELVDGFSLDVGRVRAALADEKTEEPARKLLVGALCYVIDTWDMFPDHYRGVGLADDALVLRVASALALRAGASHRGLQHLAGEMSVVRTLLGDLADPLEQFCAALPDRTFGNRTVPTILASADVRAVFEADLTRLAKKQSSVKITPPPAGAPGLVSELRKMVKSALTKEGFVK
ncbi:MAG TPA: hypothetical protein VN914_10310 [Polyangia bacterium]|nr:hypothetical protein [Polyangia bacterium]